MVTVVYDDTMCNGPYRVEHETMKDAVESVNNDFEKGIYTAPAIYAECDLKNISLGIEKASQLLDNYLVNTREVLSNLDKNVYSKALLEILDLLKL